MPNHTVFVLGAGASLAAAQARRPVQSVEHPPLDANFFARVARYRRDEYRDDRGRSLFELVASRAAALGEPDLTTPGTSLESYLGRLYFNVQHNPIAAGVRDYFTLVDLYAREVIRTTEWMVGRRAARRDDELLRRMLQQELAESRRISIITFNIDLLIEDTLECLAHRRPGASWTLSDAYGFAAPLERMALSGGDEFPDAQGTAQIKLYKMHGSVNWLFQTRDYYPPGDLMANRRQVYVLSNRHLGTGRIRHRPPTGRRWPLFPLIVPPVYEKHVLIRNNLAEVWANAEQALLDADRIAFWGYSFPAADTHARHFFQALAQRNDALKHPILVNPDPLAAQALWEVLRPTRLEHHRDAIAYLAA